jgi:hypothetical protein
VITGLGKGSGRCGTDAPRGTGDQGGGR